MLNFRRLSSSLSFSDEDVVGSREVGSHCCGVRKMPQYSLVIYAGRSVFAHIRSYLKRKDATERRVGQVGCLGGSGKNGTGSHLTVAAWCSDTRPFLFAPNGTPYKQRKPDTSCRVSLILLL